MIRERLYRATSLTEIMQILMQIGVLRPVCDHLFVLSLLRQKFGRKWTCIVVPHVQNALYFRQKVRALYYVNCERTSLFNLSFNWQSHDRVLCFEIES